MALVKRLLESQGARIFHLMIIPAGVLVLLLSSISIGTMPNINQQVEDEYVVPNWGSRCILYTRAEYLDHYNNRGECVFVRGIFVALLALVLSIVLGVKAFFGAAVFSFWAIIEFGLSVIGAVWAFIAAETITAGVNVTCKSYKDYHGYDDNVSCSYFYVGSDKQSGVFFYSILNTSQVTMMFAMGLLICLALLYGTIIITFYCRGKRVGGGTVIRELPEFVAQ